MSAIKNKLRSQRGASITFALLLFLVCAIVSSVVIIAGSASAGRMSQLAETDQRYYAVTSAAGLLCKDIDGKAVTVKRQKSGDAYTYAAESVADTRQKPAATLPPKDEALIADASEALIKAIDENGEAAPRAFALEATSLLPKTLEGAALKCVITETVDRQKGLLIFKIENDHEAKDVNGFYSLEVVFSANVKQGAADAAATTRQSTVSWTLNSISKMRIVTEADD